MFAATVGMLTFFALTVQEFLTESEQSQTRLLAFFWLTLSFYPIFWIEATWHFWIESPRRWWTLLTCAVPPLRLARRDMQEGTSMWLPVLGWRHVDEDFHEEMERYLSIPMILIAVAILPLLALEFVWTSQMEIHPWLRVTVETGYSITWLAFTMEFIVMVSIVDKKIEYLKKHWVDLLIVCLPLVAFLRVFRMTQLLRLQQVTRVTRIYRMRGLAVRVWRGLLAMDVISRLLRVSPETKIEAMRQLIEEKQREIEKLEEEIEELQATLQPCSQSAPDATVPESEAA
ncbi:hypothetical protein GC197_13955 [bacterium]|nr:hypothetical protein [bacterium]